MRMKKRAYILRNAILQINNGVLAMFFLYKTVNSLIIYNTVCVWKCNWRFGRESFIILHFLYNLPGLSVYGLVRVLKKNFILLMTLKWLPDAVLTKWLLEKHMTKNKQTKNKKRKITVERVPNKTWTHWTIVNQSSWTFAKKKKVFLQVNINGMS